MRKIKKFFNDLKRWFSYYKICKNIYDWDYTSILEVERHQLKRVRDNILKYHHHVYWDYDVRNINIALNLLAIILGEDDICEQISGNIIFKDIGSGLYELTSSCKYKLTKYVNTKNANRFVNNYMIEQFDNPDTGPLFIEDYRQEKAWKLYHKLRVEHLREFWD